MHKWTGDYHSDKFVEQQIEGEIYDFQSFFSLKVSIKRKFMMMMIAPNSLIRQKEGAQGEEEEEAGGRVTNNN